MASRWNQFLAGLGVLVLLLAPPLPAFANPREEAYRKTRLRQMKAGDWAEYEITVAVGAPLNTKLTKTRKITVTAVDKTGVAFRQEDVSGGKPETTESRLDFNDKTKPTFDSGYRQQAEGAEQVFVGEKDYDSTWYEWENQVDLAGTPQRFVDKTWYADNVPVFGVVKRDFVATTNTITTTTEILKGYGQGK